MKNLVKAIDNLPMIVKFIGVLFYGILGNLYRVARSAAAKNTLGVVLGVILLLCGGLIVLWILDLIFILMGKKIWWID